LKTQQTDREADRQTDRQNNSQADTSTDNKACYTMWTSNSIWQDNQYHAGNWTTTDKISVSGLDWIAQCFMSPPTQYRLYGRQFYRSKDPTNSIKVLKEDLQKRKKTTKTT